MKKITLFFAAAIFTSVGFAQIQSEDFEGDTLPDGWTSNIIGGTQDWTFGSGVMPGGDPFTSNAAIFDDDAAGAASIGGAELLSPPVDLTSYSDATLTYEYSMQDFAGSGIFTVEAWDGTTWQTLLTSEVDTPPTFEGPMDVTSFINDAFQVRFTYDDEGDFAWGAGVDNFSIDGTLSAGDNRISGFTMFPNPATSELNIAAATQLSNLKIFNLLGQVVIDQNANTLSEKVNISNLKTGAYLVQVTSEGQTGTYKFIKK